MRAAIRTVTFWQLLLVFSLVMLGMSSVGLHRIPHFTDQGISARLVSLAVAADATAATVATLFVGELMQRYPVRYVGSIGLALIGGAILLTIYATTVPLMFLSMVVFGLSVGTMILLQNFVWADYFGRLQAGAIRGAGMPATLAFSAAGPPLAGYVNDSTGSYNPIWWAGMALMFAGALVLFLTQPPKRGPSEREAEPEGAPAPAPA